MPGFRRQYKNTAKQMDKQNGLIYVCAKCAAERGVDAEHITPAMWHICQSCGDGPTELWEAPASTDATVETDAPAELK